MVCHELAKHNLEWAKSVECEHDSWALLKRVNCPWPQVIVSLAGTCESPAVGWDALCNDVKELILAHVVDLRVLARAAPLCQDFYKAHVTRAEEGRASLIALAEETYGKSLCHTFSTAIGRALSTLDPRSIWMGDEWNGFDEKCIFIMHAGEARHEEVCEFIEMPMEEPYGVIFEPYRDDDNYAPAKYVEVFTATLSCINPKWQGNICAMVSMVWNIYKDPAGKLVISIDVQYAEAAREALGLVLYSFRAMPEAFPASPQSPLTVNVSVSPWSYGGRGVSEAEDLLAPLRPLADSVTVNRCSSNVVPDSGGRKGQKFPLGVLTFSF
jgi:hypothetical protein